MAELDYGTISLGPIYQGLSRLDIHETRAGESENCSNEDNYVALQLVSCDLRVECICEDVATHDGSNVRIEERQ